MRIHAALLALVSVCLAASTIRNPVMRGDHPDPSVVRFEGEYWAANTSSEWAPIFPLSSSRDLRHWQTRTAVFTAPPAWAVANFWAPELTVDGGQVRVYYAARKRDGPLCVAVAAAPRPEGPYTDQGPLVCQEDGSIDPFFLRDEQGHPYLIWKEDGNSRNRPSTIFAQPTTEDGLHLTGTPTPLIRSDVPWEGRVVEGPDIIRRQGFYYLLYAGGACCGRGCNYGVGVARAKNLLGPWEKNPANPVVTSNADWRCPGHGTAVEGPDGHDYFLYHAYSQRGFVFTGREAVLDRIEWRRGWPAIDKARGPSPAGRETPAGLVDDFRAPVLEPGWQWPLADKPEVQVGGGQLTLTAPPAHAGDFLGAMLARALAFPDYSVETTVEANSLAAGQAAGLAVIGDRRNAAGIALRDGRILQWRLDAGGWTQLANEPAPAGERLRLRIECNHASQFRTWYAAGGAWAEAGQLVDVSSLPPWDRGLRVAPFASGTAPAQFAGFRLRYGPPE